MTAIQVLDRSSADMPPARHLPILIAIALSAVVLAGCAQSRKVPSAGSEAQTSSSIPSNTPSSEKAPVQESALPKSDLPKIDDDPSQLIEMTRDDLNALLGQPDLVRRENPAEIWQYRGKGCILDVFLYSENDRKDSPFKVVYSEARGRETGTTDQRACLNELLRAQLTS
ncbi:hypothetical protein [Pelagibius sp. Alg239-R121]|uniref:hypothetical protein n=1 Tax=Pelagibius sp. Alg239-R121 TaxID=2993448 RepID=UPI0024A68247|nr:hypothetical protein [Pelagibius sp. Alg239-R121]